MEYARRAGRGGGGGGLRCSCVTSESLAAKVAFLEPARVTASALTVVLEV